jgi:3-hydroxyisobutyrate dehydrogenase-like beta-hydroxyacid dehydrogenase
MVDIGFIGLGHMGFPMARRLIDAGYEVIGFDNRTEALDRLVALGARPASSPKDVADVAETVLASLPSPQAAAEVATGAAGMVEGGRVRRYVDLSTIGSATAVQIHSVLAERNIVAIDSPVSGGRRSRKGDTRDDGVGAVPRLRHPPTGAGNARSTGACGRAARLGADDEARQQHPGGHRVGGNVGSGCDGR